MSDSMSRLNFNDFCRVESKRVNEMSKVNQDYSSVRDIVIMYTGWNHRKTPLFQLSQHLTHSFETDAVEQSVTYNHPHPKKQQKKKKLPQHL